MEKEKKIVSLVNLAGNLFLFLIKIFIGLLTGSIALLADAINSLSDIFTSAITLIAVRISCKEPDKEHPFGHERAESISGLITGILIIVIGLELIREGTIKLVFGNTIQLGFLAVTVLLITMAVKSILAVYTKKTAEKTRSTALNAISEDSKADVLISFAALIGVIGAMNNYNFLDPLMALVISVYVIWNGMKIALDNSNQLIGKAPSKELIEKIKEKAMEVKGVKGVHDIKGQCVGNSVQVEIHIELDERISIQEGHSIGKNVQYSVESMKEINRAFIHLDPFKQSYFWNSGKLSRKK